ncbi:MAG: hypothetical protein RL069_1601 [Planctomycetota bacterium]
MIARAHKEVETPGAIALCRWQPRVLVEALSLKMEFWSRPTKGLNPSLKTSSDPNFGWAEKPETATKKLRNLFGFRAQFEEFHEIKHYFRDFSPRRKNQGAVEGAKSALYL